MEARPSRQFKAQVRVMGVAEGPFEWGMEKTRLVGVIVRLPGYLEDVRTTSVEVDGSDANERITELIQGGGPRARPAAILLKGVSLAGFNIIDGDELCRQVNVPVVTVCRTRPDLEAMGRALKKHFGDWAERLGVIEAGYPEAVKNGDFTIYARGFGIDKKETSNLLKKATIRGAMPEPIRLARLIARSLVVI